VVRVFFSGVLRFPEKKLSAAYVEQSNVLTYLFDEFARRLLILRSIFEKSHCVAIPRSFQEAFSGFCR
jgi:hypothetical protein